MLLLDDMLAHVVKHMQISLSTSNWMLNGAEMSERLNPLRDTADRLGVSIFTIRRLIKDGSLRAVRVSRRLLVPESEILRACHEGCSPKSRTGARQ
jgi:excisionase family DNA binding protein